jgi:hypothetical protein
LPRKINAITAIIAVVSIVLLFFLIWIIYSLDPLASSANLVLFYGTTYLLTVGFAFLGGFALRKAFGKREFLARHFQVSLRQSLWFGFIAVFGLLMASLGILNILNGSILVLMFVFLEAYFLYQPN